VVSNACARIHTAPLAICTKGSKVPPEIKSGAFQLDPKRVPAVAAPRLRQSFVTGIRDSGPGCRVELNEGRTEGDIARRGGKGRKGWFKESDAVGSLGGRVGRVGVTYIDGLERAEMSKIKSASNPIALALCDFCNVCVCVSVLASTVDYMPKSLPRGSGTSGATNNPRPFHVESLNLGSLPIR
jgi:hypothetical protein